MISHLSPSARFVASSPAEQIPDAAPRAIGAATNSPEMALGETGMVLGTGRERPLSIGLHTDGNPEARFESASLHQSHSQPRPASPLSNLDGTEQPGSVNTSLRSPAVSSSVRAA